MKASLDSKGSPATSTATEQSPSEALYQKLIAEARAQRATEAERRALEAAKAERRADRGEDEGAGS